MTQTVVLDRDGHIATVTINRPEKMNALDGSIFEGLVEIGEEVKSDPAIRVVVLKGAGGNFCAGIDINYLSQQNPADFKAHATSLPQGVIANRFQRPSYIWQEVGVPVIAALDGVVFGGGAQIALGADIRIASPDIRMSIMEMKWGIIPDMGITFSLPKLVRADVAKDLILTGRIVAADEALDIGLVTRIAEDPHAAAQEAAEAICNKNPDAVRHVKRLVEEGWTATPADGMRLEAELQSKIIGQPNQFEAIAANLQKRPPRFS